MSEKDVRMMAVRLANLLAQCPTGTEVGEVIALALRICNEGGYYAWYKSTWEKLVSEGCVELDIVRYLRRAQ